MTPYNGFVKLNLMGCQINVTHLFDHYTFLSDFRIQINLLTKKTLGAINISTSNKIRINEGVMLWQIEHIGKI